MVSTNKSDFGQIVQDPTMDPPDPNGPKISPSMEELQKKAILDTYNTDRKRMRTSWTQKNDALQDYKNQSREKKEDKEKKKLSNASGKSSTETKRSELPFPPNEAIQDPLNLKLSLGEIRSTLLKLPMPSKKKTKSSVPALVIPDKPEEKEKLICECLQFLEEHPLPDKKADAATMVRPKGYRALKFSTPMESSSITSEVGIQVKPLELQLDTALALNVAKPKLENINWPTVEYFDPESAGKLLEDYIKSCWSIDPKWMYNINFLQEHEDELRKRYVYEILFSIVTPQYPVPSATASIYFVFEISHYQRADEKVKVTYVIEGSRFAHVPGDLPFNDKWLLQIISDKLRVQREASFL